MAAVASNPSTNMFFESNFIRSMPLSSTPLPPALPRSGTVPTTMPISQSGMAPITMPMMPMSQSAMAPTTMPMSQSGLTPTTTPMSQSYLTPTAMPMSRSGMAPTSMPMMPTSQSSMASNTRPMMSMSQSGMIPNTMTMSQSGMIPNTMAMSQSSASLGARPFVASAASPFNTSSLYMPNAPIPSTISTTSPREKYEACNPYGMSDDELDTYKEKVDTLREIEGAYPPEVEPRDVSPFPIVEGVERDLLDNEVDQFEQRLRYLETLAGSAADGMREQRPQLPPRMPPPNCRWGMFDDKFIPMPLGGGWNNTAYTFYKGYYIDKDKIAQREAQLKYLGSYHQHPEIYWFAGIEKDEIDDEYWDRDIRKFAEKARKEQMEGYFGPGAVPQEQVLPIEVQQRLVAQMNQQTMNNVMLQTQMNQQVANVQNIEMMSRDIGPVRSSRSY